MSECINNTGNPRVVAFGEILWDLLPSGPKLGGAPLNFLYHTHVLGARVQSLTRVGDDERGREAVAILKSLSVPIDFVQTSSNAQTGIVNVTLDAQGTPSYTIVENVAWDEINVDDKVVEDVCQFLSGSEKSAFYYGSLALRSASNREGLNRVLKHLPESVLRVCDLNLRAPFYSKDVILFALEHADVFKLNDVEALELDELLGDVTPPALTPIATNRETGLADALDADREKTEELLRKWADGWRAKFGLKAIILTCGAGGAFLFNEGNMSYARSLEVEVADTVGAGDAFAAVCVVGLLKRLNDQKIVEAASKRAAFVCSQVGATPVVPADEADPFKE